MQTTRMVSTQGALVELGMQQGRPAVGRAAGGAVRVAAGARSPLCRIWSRSGARVAASASAAAAQPRLTLTQTQASVLVAARSAAVRVQRWRVVIEEEEMTDR